MIKEWPNIRNKPIAINNVAPIRPQTDNARASTDDGFFNIDVAKITSNFAENVWRGSTIFSSPWRDT